MKVYNRAFLVECAAKVPEGCVTDYKNDLRRHFVRPIVGSYQFELKKITVKKIQGKSGRDKGFAFEREIAKQLSLWWSDGEDANIFVKRSGSGGKKIDKSGESGYGGDLHADKEVGFPLVNLFNFELKHTNEMCMGRLVQAYSKITDAWEQCMEDARITNRVPCFIFKLIKYVYIAFPKNFLYHQFVPLIPIIIGGIQIYDLDDFFDAVDPSVFASEIPTFENEWRKW